MDPTIKRLAKSPEPLDAAQVAYVLERSVAFVCRAASRGIIEARAEMGRGTGANRRYTFSTAAVLAYLIAATTGPKTLLLGSIAEAYPHLHEWARTLASGGHPQLPVTRPRRTALPAWHPDQLSLFETPAQK